MKLKEKIIKVLKNPFWILVFLNNRGFHLLNDEQYIKMRFKLEFGYKLNLCNPKTFNEKLQWLKLYDRKEIYTKMVDKYEVKKYVSSLIGEEYIIPTLGVYDKFDDINFSQLPNQFVIKCTHDSGSIIICKNKNNFNIKKSKKIINKHLKNNFYYIGREWPYKYVTPRIIIEKYMEDENCKSMRDYKFFCFNGEPKILYISEGFENHDSASMNFYDMNFNLIDCRRKDYKQLSYKPEKPINFEAMKRLAKLLSKNIPHVRVDFYEINNNLYFGELTFFTCSGYIPFESEKWDKKLGKMLFLNK